MRKLSEAVALAKPIVSAHDLAMTEAAVYQAREGQRELEVRIGVGPMTSDVPLRVLGYAACIAESLRTDVPTIVRRADRICIFSSAPKAGNHDHAKTVCSLAAIGGALRLSGVATPIVLNIASPAQEVPDWLSINLPESIVQWFERAAGHSGNNADPNWYAREHAAPSMFGDLGDGTPTPMRLFLGGAPEARFWAARMRIRAAAVSRGDAVAPALGLILRSLSVPWYSPTPTEPPLIEMARSPESAIASLDNAANPTRPNGNSGLKREARATRRYLQRSDVLHFVDAIADTPSSARFIRENGFTVGAGLAGPLELFL